jgi:hypothetical protein
MMVATDWINARALHCKSTAPVLGGGSSVSGPYGHVRIRQVEFPTTVEADLIRAMFDREHTADVPVPAAEGKLENPK